MDWKLAIAKNREALAGVVAGLAGVTAGGVFLPRPTYRQILLILRPAEAALRRLIVIVAAVLKVRVEAKAGTGTKRPLPDFASFKQGERLGTFALIDPRKTFQPDTRWDKPEANLPPPPMPRISVPGFSDPVFAAKRETEDPDEIDIASLQRRIDIFEKALNTLPKQARRLVRLMARRSKAPPGPGRIGPIRPGLPPGYRKRHTHPVDAILQECHLLARDLANQPP